MIKYQGITTLEVLEGADNYNKWIIDQFLPYLKSPVLEIGSGTGNISRFFIPKANVFLSDIDKGLLRGLQQKFPLRKNNIIHLNIEKQTPRKFKNYFKTIIGINVLEHIKDDKKALKNVYTMLKEHGYLLLLVPAKKMAYTELDRRLGHYRRYEKSDLQKKLLQAGFSVEKLYAFNFIGLFSWIIRDKIERGNQLKHYQVVLFDKLVPILRRIEKAFQPIVGISFIVIARKKK